MLKVFSQIILSFILAIEDSTNDSKESSEPVPINLDLPHIEIFTYRDCGHCKTAKPEFELLTTLQPTKIYDFHNSEDQAYITQEQIQAFPTIRFVKGNEKVAQNLPHDAQAISSKFEAFLAFDVNSFVVNSSTFDEDSFFSTSDSDSSQNFTKVLFKTTSPASALVSLVREFSEAEIRILNDPSESFLVSTSLNPSVRQYSLENMKSEQTLEKIRKIILANSTLPLVTEKIDQAFIQNASRCSIPFLFVNLEVESVSTTDPAEALKACEAIVCDCPSPEPSADSEKNSEDAEKDESECMKACNEKKAKCMFMAQMSSAEPASIVFKEVESLREFARSNRSQADKMMAVGAISDHGMLASKLKKMLGITDEVFALILFMNKEKQEIMKYALFSSSFSIKENIQRLEDFTENFFSGKLEVYYKSEEIPSYSDLGPFDVREIVGKNYSSFLDTEKPFDALDHNEEKTKDEDSRVRIILSYVPSEMVRDPTDGSAVGKAMSMLESLSKNLSEKANEGFKNNEKNSISKSVRIGKINLVENENKDLEIKAIPKLIFKDKNNEVVWGAKEIEEEGEEGMKIMLGQKFGIELVSIEKDVADEDGNQNSDEENGEL